MYFSASISVQQPLAQVQVADKDHAHRQPDSEDCIGYQRKGEAMMYFPQAGCGT